MEIHQPEMQLVFNVVAITAITSLTVISHLLKKDKDKLAIELKLRRSASRNESTTPAAEPAQSSAANGGEADPAKPARPAQASADQDGMAAMRQDIREFVAGRAQGWVAPPGRNRLKANAAASR
jgi:hypothetical protein